MHKFPFHLSIPITIKPVIHVIPSATIETNAPFINVPLVSTGSQATIPTGVLFVAV